MWGWFGGGGSAQNRKDSPKNAILGLRSQLDMLQKRQTHLENQISDQDATARKHVAANNTSGKPDMIPGEGADRFGIWGTPKLIDVNSQRPRQR